MGTKAWPSSHEYALVMVINVPWVDIPNPGHHCTADGTMTTTQQRDSQTIWAARRVVWVSQDNVQRASIAVPKQCKQTNGIGTANYKTNQSIREILAGLREYGVPTPNEVTANETNFAKPYFILAKFVAFIFCG